MSCMTSNDGGESLRQETQLIRGRVQKGQQPLHYVHHTQKGSINPNCVAELYFVTSS